MEKQVEERYDRSSNRSDPIMATVGVCVGSCLRLE